MGIMIHNRKGTMRDEIMETENQNKKQNKKEKEGNEGNKLMGKLKWVYGR